MLTPRRFLALLLTAVALSTSFTTAQAQCFQDDGFNVPGVCCIPVNPILPLFPGQQIPAEGCVFKDCNPGTVFPEIITLSPSIQLFCDIYLLQIQLNGLVNLPPALMIAKYTRTWLETDATGVVSRQVWRFLVNVDLVYPAGGPPAPIPTPTVATLGQPVHFIGSLDYSRDCATGTWRAAINLTYLCEAFMHGTMSVRPNPVGTNVNLVYSFVGPVPFNWGVGAPPVGPTIADSVRTTRYNLGVSPFLWTCLSEMPTFGGLLTNNVQYCACEQAPGIGAPAWTQQTLQFKYGCSSAVSQNYNSVPWAPLLPTGLSAFNLGTYATPPGVFPGTESVSLYMGVATAPDPCANGFPIHLVTGVGTSGGDLAIVDSITTGGPITTTEFLDLENMLVLIGGPPFIAIGLGGIFLSTSIFSLNF